MERKSSRVVALVLTGHALAAAWTWRDIRQQSAQQVGGVKPSGGSPARWSTTQII
jgi:hypothetical protein